MNSKNDEKRFSSKQKRKIRQEVYFVLRFGAENHLWNMSDKRFFKQEEPLVDFYLNDLHERIKSVLQTEPLNERFISYEVVVNFLRKNAERLGDGELYDEAYGVLLNMEGLVKAHMLAEAYYEDEGFIEFIEKPFDYEAFNEVMALINDLDFT